MEKEKATIDDYARFCKHNISNCKKCPLSHCGNNSGLGCSMFVKKHTDKANEIILKWIKEHPVKTRQSELLKAFPNVPIDYTVSSICPIDFDKFFDAEMCHCYKDCTTCKKEYWLTEVEENEL